MAIKITKPLENFVSKIQNHNFVGTIHRSYLSLNDKMAPGVERVNETLFKFVCKSKAGANRSWKYVTGKSRLRSFLMNSIKTFDHQHTTLSSMIEKGDLLGDPKSKEVYNNCKQEIGIILRANRRISKKTSSQAVTSFVSQYIHAKRMASKYNFAT